jgi:hypothetical protein
MQRKIPLPRHLSQAEREEVGRQIIQTIQNRTLEGLDLEGRPFAPYSKRYIDSREFKAAGKSPSEVNLRLTEEMMNAMEVQGSEPGSVTIGFNSIAAAQKAEWAEASDNGPSRKFFDVTPTELSNILAQYAAPQTATRTLAMDILQRIFTIGR